jgi:dsRNA-specific ribonuclease
MQVSAGWIYPSVGLNGILRAKVNFENHLRAFIVLMICQVADVEKGRGIAPSKTAAKEEAAKQALLSLGVLAEI